MSTMEFERHDGIRTDESRNQLRATVLQTDIVWCHAAANREHLESLLRDAPSSDIYLLPEMFATGFCMQPGLPGVAATAEDTLEWMRQ